MQLATEINHRAIFVNCDNHSLNLAGVNCAKENSLFISFLGRVKNIYIHFFLDQLYDGNC